MKGLGLTAEAKRFGFLAASFCCLMSLALARFFSCTSCLCRSSASETAFLADMFHFETPNKVRLATEVAVNLDIIIGWNKMQYRQEIMHDSQITF